LKTKGKRYKNAQRVQKLLKIRKMSPAEVTETENGGEIVGKKAAKPVMANSHGLGRHEVHEKYYYIDTTITTTR